MESIQVKKTRDMLKAFRQSMTAKLDNLIKEIEEREQPARNNVCQKCGKSLGLFVPNNICSACSPLKDDEGQICKKCGNYTGLRFSDNTCNDCYYGKNRNIVLE